MKLLKKANKLTVAKGKKVVEFSGKEKTSEDAVMAMLGSTGNLRLAAIWGPAAPEICDVGPGSIVNLRP